MQTSQISQKSSTATAASARRGEMYTMAALESAIRANPQPLLLFAALKDFSGENISFLTKVLEWKRDWAPSSPTRSGFVRRPSVQEINNKALQRQQFKKAVAIYAAYVSLRYSEFPINISHAHLKELEAVFEGAALVLYGHCLDDSDNNSATPFDTLNFASRLWHSTSSSNLKSANSVKDMESAPVGNSQNQDRVSISSRKTQHTSSTNNSTDLILQNTEDMASKCQPTLQTYEMTNVIVDLLPDYVPIPTSFGPRTFDNAESSIKYMVLTNAWPKFVNAGYADTGMSEEGGFLKTVTLRFFGK